MGNDSGNDSVSTYWYEGRCPRSGDRLRLPRTVEVEAIACHLMQQLASNECDTHEGKMYGVLLAETETGERHILKAFSGLLNGQALVPGWVPPIPGRDQVALTEAQTLMALESIKQELMTLEFSLDQQEYDRMSSEFKTRLDQLAISHKERKEKRGSDRQVLLQMLTGEELAKALETLDEQSRRDGIERRNIKRERSVILSPLKQKIERDTLRIQVLKKQRKDLSRQLQTQMHESYHLINFFGTSASLQQLMPQGMPTGTGDCCAPKLLHYAATHHLRPMAMAEFWWGSTTADKIQGEFYGACAERCQPLMGFLLSGLSALPSAVSHPDWEIPILYEDEWLIAVNKPTGLLSIPGRYGDRRDSVLTHLWHRFSQDSIFLVHRLDQGTSGILLFARDRQTRRHLSQQFQQRHVHKVYQAILSGSISVQQGVIDLPLWSDPQDRPLRKVDWQRGKASITHFQVMAHEGSHTRVKFLPLTGRTHQLRVHAADPQGLGVPILGDRLYGDPEQRKKGDRLYLHAQELSLQHPQTQQPLHLKLDPAF
jgi:tRNA pseudouridine32 synthase / 23S rRNA pseudouridine746 synthase